MAVGSENTVKFLSNTNAVNYIMNRVDVRNVCLLFGAVCILTPFDVALPNLAQ